MQHLRGMSESAYWLGHFILSIIFRMGESVVGIWFWVTWNLDAYNLERYYKNTDITLLLWTFVMFSSLQTILGMLIACIFKNGTYYFGREGWIGTIRYDVSKIEYLKICKQSS